MIICCHSISQQGEFITSKGEKVIINKFNEESFRFRIIGKSNTVLLDASVSFDAVIDGGYWYEGHCKDGYQIHIVPERSFSAILNNGISHISDKNVIWISQPRYDKGFMMELTRRIK